MNEQPVSTHQSRPAVSFWEAFRFWLTPGFVSFGGPAGQVALMHGELVDAPHRGHRPVGDKRNVIHIIAAEALLGLIPKALMALVVP